MIRKILVAYDNSELAERVFAQAIEIARLAEAEIAVVAVAAAPVVGDDVEAEAIIENSRESYEKRFAALKTNRGTKGLKLQFEVLVGHPAQHIVDYAKQTNVDLIVVGHRSRKLVGRLVMGSVARHMIDHAHCAVLVIK
jgi:nucleotide-binding universal stress UspA family protein